LLSDEHFTVDGTLIEAWAGQKSFKKKDEPSSPPSPGGEDPSNPTVDFHGEKRSNDTHQSTTDPEARLAKKGKGKEAKLAYQGHVLMENRHGLVVEAEVTQASGTAEREAALEMLDRRGNEPGVTLGADKNYDTRDFVAGCRERRVTPHVAQNNTHRSSAIDGWADDPTPRLCGESTPAQAGGRNLRLDQDGGLDGQDALPRMPTRGMDVHAASGGLQSGPPQ
jgi:DDE family transposase